MWRGVLCEVQEDGLLVRLLKQAGAIPFVKGNVPQSLLLPESENAVFGRSLNPWDASRCGVTGLRARATHSAVREVERCVRVGV
jgi:Asp-tRNA(Asn)/Glu-tRNA(Gln) amidotransferase A subunit family amidase